MKDEKIRKLVRRKYANIATKDQFCCQPQSSSKPDAANLGKEVSKRIGYSEKEINSVPEGANLGLGCGNPVALAPLKQGQTVLDLGSGGGFDCFLAARKVGRKGKVIGVDMTPEMIDKARENSRKGRYENVEFRLGEIENLPVADGTVDVIISNCVINLSPNKKRVFKEAFRVLKPSGRLMVSDIVLLKKLPEVIRKDVQAYVACISGAEMKGKYLQMIKDAGFREVEVVEENYFSVENIASDPTVHEVVKTSGVAPEEARKIATTVASAKVRAIKPDAR
jgi:ubiquinone/menaquinone biosynthesis C-methylase UbiE